MTDEAFGRTLQSNVTTPPGKGLNVTLQTLVIRTHALNSGKHRIKHLYPEHRCLGVVSADWLVKLVIQ
jgi:hypothetical protein